MNFNVSASLNVTKLFFKPGICLPHCTVSTFNDVPIPLDKGLQKNGRKSDIRAVVLDKDDCFAYPDAKEVYEPYKRHFEDLKQAYPGRRLLVVSNTSGATSWDKDLKQAAQVETSTGVHVLSHSVKKPGCGAEIMAYFKQHPETGVTDPSHIAVVGDRLTTDMMLANMMGGWGFWIKDGVVPMQQKSIPAVPSTNKAVTVAMVKRQRGKHWTNEEERYFWRTVIPLSPKVSDTKTWSECGEMMAQAFGDKYRQYTSATIFEHYFQNVRSGRTSPKAGPYLEEHKRYLQGKEESGTGQWGTQTCLGKRRDMSNGESTNTTNIALQDGERKRIRNRSISRKPLPSGRSDE
ncbi:hypothetical protein QQS21_009062 [Conoideocrella luteorostrata]|uniref:Uncharacterized protein n=1 Tax=Conoideocrella luteorostrata TaxID=1105319 RepID=A0AAJ0CIH7_9HYPO|nr:hypothetical protein QQS21_009062 [Conoideocrella luteorostrata]